MTNNRNDLDQLNDDELLALMQSLDVSLTSTSGPHFVNNDELLDRWSKAFGLHQRSQSVLG